MSTWSAAFDRPPRTAVRQWQDVAIIGLSGRFPGADDVEEFWANLEGGHECITRFDDEELLKAGISPAILGDPRYVKAAPVLRGHDEFDAAFFGFTPSEAALMDPQHRVFLECAWHALEHAGYCSERERLRTAVFAGCALNTYLPFAGLAGELESNFVPTLIANDKDFLATRVSYKLNLTGPSVTVQTACSTSLVAIHLACASLINGEADLALAGGVAVKVPQKAGYLCKSGSIVSPDGRCRPFDAGANGTIFGSGAGVVVLKRLADALCDRDTVLAVIKGTAVNNDGADKASFAAPQVLGQSQAILEALTVGGISADTVSFVEAHGTGTRLGDPIEVAALSVAFGRDSQRTGHCWLGSVKANVGHLDAAAGVTGVIKVVQALRHRIVPPTIHFETPNPEIDFEAGPFCVNNAPVPWLPSALPRRAAVNGLGVGGTNAFVILEEPPPPPQAWHATDPFCLAVVSAKTPAAREVQSAAISSVLRARTCRREDVCFTLQVGRRGLPYREAWLLPTQAASADGADETASAARFASHCERAGRPVVFLFGDGCSLDAGRWAALYGAVGPFREALEACLAALPDNSGAAVLLAAATGDDRSGSPKPPTPSPADEFVATFILHLALARCWAAAGLNATAAAGCGLGELTAACAAGVLSPEQGLQVVSRWAEFIADFSPEGRAATIACRASELEHWLDRDAWVSVETAPDACVIAGAVGKLTALIGELQAQQIEAAAVPHRVWPKIPGHHSFAAELLATLGPMRLARPRMPILCAADAAWIEPAEAVDPLAWARRLCAPTRWGDALRKLRSELEPVWVCFGADAPSGSALGDAGDQDQATNAAPRIDAGADLDSLYRGIAGAWVNGADVDWTAFNRGHERGRVPLPTYPFDRRRCWPEPQRGSGVSAPSNGGTPPHLSRNQLVRGPRPASAAALAKSGSLVPLRQRADDFVTPMQCVVGRMWADVLGLSQVGLHDDFFALGGDSIMIVDLVDKINTTFGLDLPLFTVFESSTVHDLAQLIEYVFAESCRLEQASGADNAPAR